jgi:cell division protein FtsZ
MSIHLHLPENIILRPTITVFGVGGAGCNAVNNMIASGLEGARFVVANTDAQCLEYSKTEKKLQLGEVLTRGLGAGASPVVGKEAAEEAIEGINHYLGDSNMIFITAGMGGGTGTGAAPVIAKAARERGILTVAVVTKPFLFEGAHRMKIAESGIAELQQCVDTLIIIPNQNLFRIANEKTTFADAFKMADDVLRDGVRSITDLMIMPGLINLDFADIKSVMSEMGKAMMGAGQAEGENRAITAAEAAISNPLLDNSSMKGAKGVLINITGGSDMTLFEVDEAANRVREEVDPNANIIFGSAFNDGLEGKIRVSVVATGIEDPNNISYRLTSHMDINRPKITIPTFDKKVIKPAFGTEAEQDAAQTSLTFEEKITPQPSLIEETENKIELTSEENEDKDNISIADEAKEERPSTFARGQREEVPKPKNASLFEKVMGSIWSSGSSKKEENNYKNKFSSNSERSKKDNNDDDDDYIEISDIPAFLRRKKD